MTTYQYALAFEDVQTWEARRELNAALADSVRIEQAAATERVDLLERVGIERRAE